MTAPILSLAGLSKAYGGRKIIDDLSIEITDAGPVALIGANGAGKTSCFNMIGGQVSPDSGCILFMGQDITQLASAKRARLGLGRGFQITKVFAGQSVLDNMITALLLAEGAELNLLASARRRFQDQAHEALAQLSLDHLATRPAAQLAYGDAKRLELALALAARPTLLLLDEPTAGMPAPERQSMMAEIARRAAEANITLFFTEHDMDLVFAQAKRVLVLDQGKLIADGSPSEVRADARAQASYFSEHPPC